MGTDLEGASTRTILLADADAFYVAVARLLDPDGVGKARLLVVGGSAQGRGVVTSASYETRAYGVRSGMPMSQAMRLCPNAVRVGVPGKECRQKSREIRTVLQRFTPVVEAASIDEFYLDMTGTDQLYGGEPLETTAGRIRDAVLTETGVAVSIGCGSSKLIAKLAAKQAKPHRGTSNGVKVVPAGQELAFLAGLQLADIPGIGPRLQEKLAERGLTTISEALDLPEGALTGWLGDRAGRWLYRRIRGLDAAPVSPHAPAKSMSHEETFPVDIESDVDLNRELLRLSGRVAADLRGRNLKARTVTVKLRDTDFTTRQASRTLARPVDSDRPIGTAARRLLAQLRRDRRVPARLLGVALSNLGPSDAELDQLSLFEESDESERDRQLSRVVDDINARFGRDHILRGNTMGPHQ
jgi:DNA polymerase-4